MHKDVALEAEPEQHNTLRCYWTLTCRVKRGVTCAVEVKQDQLPEASAVMLRTRSSYLEGPGSHYTSMWHCPDCFALWKMTWQSADWIRREEDLEKRNQSMHANYFNSGSIVNLSGFLFKKTFLGIANLNNQY